MKLINSNVKYFIIVILGVFYLHENTAECYWNFPLEQDVASQYWQEYPERNDLGLAMIIPELPSLGEFHPEYSIYEDSQMLYENIYYHIAESRSSLSIREMMEIIDLKTKIFLEHCDYLPLSYEEFLNPEHPFHNFLTVIAVTSENSNLSVIKDFFCILGSTLIKNTLSYYPDILESREYTIIEMGFLKHYTTVSIPNNL